MSVRLHSSWKKEKTKETKETKENTSLKKLLNRSAAFPPQTNAQTQWIKFQSYHTMIFINSRYIFSRDYLYYHSLCTLYTHPGQVKQMYLGLKYENIVNPF